MTAITIRLAHYQTRTPIAELQGVESGATLSSLRTKAEQHLATEEACMMRVFAQWHVEITVAGRRRAVELTAQDEGSSLASLGIEDYSEVLLEGPLTGDFEGVGQGLALMSQLMRQQNTHLLNVIKQQHIRIEGMMQQLTDMQKSNIEMHNRTASILVLPSIENTNRQALESDERRTFGLFPLQIAAEKSRHNILCDEARTREGLLAASRYEFQQLLRFAIDTTTLHPGVVIEDPYTAVKTANNQWVTLRSSQPLSPNNCRWSVKIHKSDNEAASNKMVIVLGILPRLPADKANSMGHSYINSLGGWCLHSFRGGSYARGDWQCEPLSFGEGDLVAFDYSFHDKTLTIRCGSKQVVGHIPKMKDGEQLYPAVTLHRQGSRISFEKLPIEYYMNQNVQCK